MSGVPPVNSSSSYSTQDPNAAAIQQSIQQLQNLQDMLNQLAGVHSAADAGQSNIPSHIPHSGQSSMMQAAAGQAAAAAGGAGGAIQQLQNTGAIKPSDAKELTQRIDALQKADPGSKGAKKAAAELAAALAAAIALLQQGGSSSGSSGAGKG